MPRIPFVDPESSPEHVRQALERAPDLGLFRMIGHAESAFIPWLRYGASLLSELEMDPVLRELVILQVAHLVESEYEWVQHVPITKAVGGTDEQIAAIESGDLDSIALDETQRAILRLTGAVVDDGTGTEDQVAAAAEAIGDRQVVELLLVIGQYMSVARLIATLGVEPDDPVTPSDLVG